VYHHGGALVTPWRQARADREAAAIIALRDEERAGEVATEAAVAAWGERQLVTGWQRLGFTLAVMWTVLVVGVLWIDPAMYRDAVPFMFWVGLVPIVTVWALARATGWIVRGFSRPNS
jgi:hypothetical protein